MKPLSMCQMRGKTPIECWSCNNVQIGVTYHGLFIEVLLEICCWCCSMKCVRCTRPWWIDGWEKWMHEWRARRRMVTDRRKMKHFGKSLSWCYLVCHKSSMDSFWFVLRLPVSNHLSYGTKTHFMRYKKKKRYDEIMK
jgi:hypothetical protein